MKRKLIAVIPKQMPGISLDELRKGEQIEDEDRVVMHMKYPPTLPMHECPVMTQAEALEKFGKALSSKGTLNGAQKLAGYTPQMSPEEQKLLEELRNENRELRMPPSEFKRHYLGEWEDHDAIRYAAINVDTLRKQAEAEAIKKAMKKDATYNLRLTQEEITILWGLLNDNKGNLCYAQLLAKVEQLRPQGGFYDPHNTQQKRKV